MTAQPNTQPGSFKQLSEKDQKDQAPVAANAPEKKIDPAAPPAKAPEPAAKPGEEKAPPAGAAKLEAVPAKDAAARS